MHDKNGKLSDQPYGNEGQCYIHQSFNECVNDDLAEKNGASLFLMRCKLWILKTHQ